MGRRRAVFKSCAAVSLAVLLCGAVHLAQAQAATSKNPPKAMQAGSAEQRTARALDVAKQNPLALRAFLVSFPKGADLHNHLSGAVYAESWIRAAAEDNMCVEVSTLTLVRSQPGALDAAGQPVCADGQVPAQRAYVEQSLYDELIDAFSMRGFVLSAGVTGHDHFFGTFAKFGAEDPRHTGEWLDEVATRAAAQNEQYLELMVTPPFPKAVELAKQFGWRSDSDFGAFRSYLLSHGIQQDVAAARSLIDEAEGQRNRLEHCGEQSPMPACGVKLRYLYQILRSQPKEQVFAQTIAGFETISADPRFVGINYVQPEDSYIAMNDYALHMKIVEYMHQAYPRAHISLHAGELALGLVPPDGLCCHIRLAVEQAHAERIGHGVDLMYENHPYDLLKEMAAKHVAVEICLSSEDVILGAAGKEHPLLIYRQVGVPVALSTDDEGVSRIDITHEYERAVETYGLSYEDLKQIARTGIEHSFLPGASLWQLEDRFDRAASPCMQEALGADKPGAACQRFLQSSEKAQQQWELERRFKIFEANH